MWRFLCTVTIRVGLTSSPTSSVPLQTPLEEFFEEFGDCFHRNSRWSTSRQVPKLGDNTTPIEEVQKFYEFWCVQGY